MVEFSWNEIKAKSNLKKHGVSFEEAQFVFYDDLAVQFYDEDSSDEERFLLLGKSNESRILMGCTASEGMTGKSLELSLHGKPQRTSNSIIRVVHYEERVRFIKNEGTEKPLCLKTQKAGYDPS